MTLKTLGSECEKFRKEKNITRAQVARELGMSVANIYSFENGNNDSAYIYDWYIYNGFTYRY